MYTWTPDGSTLLILDSHGLSRLQRPAKRGGNWRIKTDAKRRGEGCWTDQAGQRAMVADNYCRLLELPSLKKLAEQWDSDAVGLSPDGSVIVDLCAGVISLKGFDGAFHGRFPVPGAEGERALTAVLDADGCGAVWGAGSLWLFDVQDMPARGIVWVDQVPWEEAGCSGAMLERGTLLWKERAGRIAWWVVGRDGNVAHRGEEAGSGMTGQGQRIAWRSGDAAQVLDLRDGSRTAVMLGQKGAAAGDGELILGPQELFFLPWPGIALEEPPGGAAGGRSWLRGDPAHLPLWEHIGAVMRRYNAAGAEVGVQWAPEVEVKDQRYGMRWRISGEGRDLAAELMASAAHGSLYVEQMEQIGAFRYMSYGSSGGIPATSGPITRATLAEVDALFRRHGISWLSTQHFWSECASGWIGQYGRRSEVAERVEPDAAEFLSACWLEALAGPGLAALEAGALADTLAPHFMRVQALGYAHGRILGWLLAATRGPAALPFFLRMLTNGTAENDMLGWGGGTLGDDMIAAGAGLLRRHPELRAQAEAWRAARKLNQRQEWVYTERLMAQR